MAKTLQQTLQEKINSKVNQQKQIQNEIKALEKAAVSSSRDRVKLSLLQGKVQLLSQEILDLKTTLLQEKTSMSASELKKIKPEKIIDAQSFVKDTEALTPKQQEKLFALTTEINALAQEEVDLQAKIKELMDLIAMKEEEAHKEVDSEIPLPGTEPDTTPQPEGDGVSQLDKLKLKLKALIEELEIVKKKKQNAEQQKAALEKFQKEKKLQLELEKQKELSFQHSIPLK